MASIDVLRESAITKINLCLQSYTNISVRSSLRTALGYLATDTYDDASTDQYVLASGSIGSAITVITGLGGSTSLLTDAKSAVDTIIASITSTDPYLSLGTTLVRGLNRTIWISPRTDGLPGTGTAIDPFDVGIGPGQNSTHAAAKYRDILLTYQPNYTILYAAGQFYTYGQNDVVRNTAFAGVKHYGAGRGQTILTLIGATSALEGNIFKNSSGPFVDVSGFEIQNMTLNPDAANQPKWTAGSNTNATGVVVRGSNIVIRGVEIINWGNNAADAEGFPLAVNASISTGTYHDVIIEDCYVHQPAGINAGPGVTVISNGLATGATGNNLVIRNCHVDAGPYAANNVKAFSGQLIENCFAENVTRGFYAEPPFYAAGLITVQNSTFKNCSQGVTGFAHAGTAQVEGVISRNNTFTDVAEPHVFNSDDGATVWREIVIENCRWRKADGTLYSTGKFVFTYNSVHAIVRNNIVDSSDPFAVYVQGTDATVIENRNQSGSLVGYYLNGVQATQGATAPKFSVYNAAGLSVTTATQTKMVWDTEVFDTNSNFASDKFTPTVAGKYILSAGVTFLGSSAGTQLRMTLYKNGAEFARMDTAYPGASSSNPHIAGTVIVNANGSTDYFEIYVYHEKGSNMSTFGNAASAWFTGALLP